LVLIPRRCPDSKEINMLEIFLLWTLSKKIAEIAKNKGRMAAGYVVLFIFSWIFGEFAGAVFGAIATGGEGLGLYVFAIVGAAAGAIFSFVLVSSLPAVRREEHGFDGWDDEPYDRNYAPLAREKKPALTRDQGGRDVSDAYRSSESKSFRL
jgi:hypothetical protein